MLRLGGHATGSLAPLGPPLQLVHRPTDKEVRVDFYGAGVGNFLCGFLTSYLTLQAPSINSDITAGHDMISP